MKFIDLTDKRFDMLTVLEFAGRDKTGAILWLCRCGCGKEKIIRGDSFKSGSTKSCGCIRRADLIGQRFERLLVISFAYSKKGSAYWNCVCDCGNKKVIRTKELMNSDTKSCGCIRIEKIAKIGRSPISEETLRRMSEAQEGRIITPETRKKMSESHLGEKSYNYNPNLTDKERMDRRCVPGIEQFRCDVYTRDKYTCQLCGDNEGGNLVAHHINGWNLFPEQQLIVKNGITLCETCHKDFHHQYGYGNNTKKQWEEHINGSKNDCKNKSCP